MNLLTLGVVTYLALAHPGGPAGKARPVEGAGQGAGVEGSWEVMLTERNGKVLPGSGVSAVRLTVKGARVVVTVGGKEVAEGRVVFTQSLDGKPSTFTYLHVTGPKRGQTDVGIYSLRGDRLTMCIGAFGAPRPTEFDNGGNRTLQLLHRLKR